MKKKDFDFDKKRRDMITHFKKAHDKGLVHCPRGFNQADHDNWANGKDRRCVYVCICEKMCACM